MTIPEIDKMITTLRAERVRLEDKPEPLTVESVYRKSLEEVMAFCPGYAPLREQGVPVVRIPVPVEWFATDPAFDRHPPYGSHVHIYPGGPRLILVKQKRWAYPVLDEGRGIRKGELYVGAGVHGDDRVYRASNCYPNLHALALGKPHLEDG